MKKIVFCKKNVFSVIFLLSVFALCGCKKSKYNNVKKVRNLKIGTYNGKKCLIGCNKNANTINITDDLGIEVIASDFIEHNKDEYIVNEKTWYKFDNFVLSKTVKDIEVLSYNFEINNLFYNGTIADMCDVYHEYKSDGTKSEHLPYSVTFGTGSTPVHNIYEKCNNVYILDNYGDIVYGGNRYKKLEDIIIPKNVKNIKKRAFNNIKSIKSVTIEEGVESIGDYAFNNCSNLEKVVMPNSINYIGIGAFSFSEKLNDINLSNNINCLNDGVFFGCYNLEQISLPSSIKKIDDRAFAHCNLKSIELPDGLKYMGHRAFYNCKNLTNIELPKSLEFIGYEAFFYCDNLEKLIVPKNVTSIMPLVNFNNPNSGLVISGEDVTMWIYSVSEIRMADYIILPDKTDDYFIWSYYYGSSNSEINYLVISKDVKEINIMLIYPWITNQFDYNLSPFKHVCYTGTREEWDSIKFYFGYYTIDMFSEAMYQNKIDKEDIEDMIMDAYKDYDVEYLDFKVYFYSEEEPIENKGDFWHYVDEKPRLWEE